MLRCLLFVLPLVLVMYGCDSSKRLSSTAAKPPTLPEALLQKQLNGVDFFAKGISPATWTLEMEFGNLFRFKSIDGNDLNTSAVNPITDQASRTVTYTAKATNGSMIVTVSDEPCSDKTSGETYSKTVVVTVNNKRYVGCGQYLFDAALDGRWTLEKINNRQVVAANFSKGVPELTFKLAERTVSGHDGCNQVNSTLEVLGSKIKFEPFSSTKMACPSVADENKFLQLLSNQTVDYYFKEAQLYFYLPDDSIIIFSRAK